MSIYNLFTPRPIGRPWVKTCACHWLALDVYDVGDYREAATGGIAAAGRPARIPRPGMTMMVEPGTYIRPAADVPEQY